MPFSIFSWGDKRKRKDDRKSVPQSSQDSGFEGSSISSSSSYATTSSSSYTATRQPVSADSNLFALPHPRNQQCQPTYLQNHQYQHHHHTHATIHSISSSRSHHPARQLPFSTSSSTASSWSASAAPTPSPKTRFPQYRIFSYPDSRQCPPLSPPHPFLSSSLSTASSTPPRSHPAVAHRFKTAFVRSLPRRPKKGVLSSSSSLSLPSFRNKAWRLGSSSSPASCVTVTAPASSSAVACTRSNVGNSMFHAGASRANSSVAEHPSSGSVACSFHGPSYSSCSSTSTVATTVSTPVISTIHPLEITAPACFPGTRPEDIASKYEQLQQLQQSSRRPSVQRANLQRQQSSQHHHQQHRVLTCPPASIAVTTTGSNVGGGSGGGRRHLIPPHHCLQGVAGLGPPGGISSECACPSTPGAPGLPCSSPPSPSISTTAPFQIPLPLPNASWSSIMNNHRSSLSGRSMNEMEVVSATTLQQQSPPSPLHRASLTIHSSASSVIGACSSTSLDRQRCMSSQSTTSSLVVLRPKILQPQNASSPLYPYQGERKPLAASLTTVDSSLGPEKPTTSSFGQGYDISTMFKVGPLTLPSPPSSIPFSSKSVAVAPTAMAS